MTTCPKCAYTRQASDTAPDYECPKCGIVYAKYDAKRLVHLSQKIEKHNQRHIEKHEEDSDPSENSVPPTLEAGVSAALVVVGCFAPLVTMPIVGSISATQLKFSDGYILLALAILAVCLANFRRVKGVLICGVLCFLITAIDLLMMYKKVGEAKEVMKSGAAGELLGGIVAAAANAIKFEWGWLFLFAGAIGLIATGMGYRLRLSVQRTERPD